MENMPTCDFPVDTQTSQSVVADLNAASEPNVARRGSEKRAGNSLSVAANINVAAKQNVAAKANTAKMNLTASGAAVLEKLRPVTGLTVGKGAR